MIQVVSGGGDLVDLAAVVLETGTRSNSQVSTLNPSAASRSVGAHALKYKYTKTQNPEPPTSAKQSKKTGRLAVLTDGQRRITDSRDGRWQQGADGQTDTDTSKTSPRTPQAIKQQA